MFKFFKKKTNTEKKIPDRNKKSSVAAAKKDDDFAKKMLEVSKSLNFGCPEYKHWNEVDKKNRASMGKRKEIPLDAEEKEEYRIVSEIAAEIASRAFPLKSIEAATGIPNIFVNCRKMETKLPLVTSDNAVIMQCARDVNAMQSAIILFIHQMTDFSNDLSAKRDLNYKYLPNEHEIKLRHEARKFYCADNAADLLKCNYESIINGKLNDNNYAMFIKSMSELEALNGADLIEQVEKDIQAVRGLLAYAITSADAIAAIYMVCFSGFRED